MLIIDKCTGEKHKIGGIYSNEFTGDIKLIENINGLRGKFKHSDGSIQEHFYGHLWKHDRQSCMFPYKDGIKQYDF